MLVAVLGAVLLSSSGGTAFAQAPPDETQQDPPPGSIGGLSPTQHNVELVGKVRVDDRFGDVRPEQIADVATKGDYAYLNSWQSPQQDSCERGGFYVVDISDPTNPKEVTFVDFPEGTYPGEGAHVLALDTPAFKGDVLLTNNEYCLESGTGPTRRGGISLYDVTDPTNPKPLATNVGDSEPDDDFDPVLKPNPEHNYHSVFGWQDANRAFAVATDNVEVLSGDDVDILEITNPRAPVLLHEFNLRDEVAGSSAYANQAFLHDMIVKEIDGVQTMLLSYWDGGYVKLNVEDPANPVFIGDTDFAATDPLFPPFSPPSGNAHQAEFSHDNRFIVGADEEFAPFRSVLRILSGPNPGPYNVAEFTDGPRIQEQPDRRIAPLTRYVGRACDGDPIPAPPSGDGDKIAVIQRGTCFFAVKAQNVKNAGYDAFIVFNNPGRPDGDPLLTNAVAQSTLPGIFMTRADGLKIFDRNPGDPSPPLGALGRDVSATSDFDGWGYAHLYRNDGTLQEIDQYAVREAQEERFANDFGDLSIHETANDPLANLAYLAYYDAGFRVLSFGDAGMDEVGRFIDSRGNNFWGVETTMDKAGNRLILASDRAYGLYILRYTGPGAVKAPPPAPGVGISGSAGLSKAPCSNRYQGTAAGERLDGSNEGDRIAAAGGNDVVTGREGIDCLLGEAGDDQLDGDEGGDSLDGGDGRDRAFGGTGADKVQGGAARDNLRGGSGNDDVAGQAGNDALSGGSNNDTVSGGSGSDSVDGDAGNDRLFGGPGNDSIDTGKGTNRVSGGSGNDRIIAANGRRDRITCGKGRDRVRADRTDRVAGDCERVLRTRR